MGSDDFPTQRGGPDDEMTRRELVDGASVFGRYRLEAVAGRGGMGVVWKAYDEELQRTVALKVLPDEVASDPEAMEELRRETRRCLELTHPNIVRVHDFVHDHRRAAIAMEFVEGAGRPPLPAAWALPSWPRWCASCVPRWITRMGRPASCTVT